jgi:hypothetical protein
MLVVAGDHNQPLPGPEVPTPWGGVDPEKWVGGKEQRRLIQNGEISMKENGTHDWMIMIN